MEERILETTQHLLEVNTDLTKEINDLTKEIRRVVGVSGGGGAPAEGATPS